MLFPNTIQHLINHFSSLPGIGQKTAERLVFYLLKQDKKTLADFGESLMCLKDKVKKCELCGQITEQNLCSICADSRRNQAFICVVAESADIAALEKSGQFQGVYHVLNGLVNPTEGITPDKLNIQKLEARVSQIPIPTKGGLGGVDNKSNGDKIDKIKEIILALNPTIEGETTNLCLTKILKKYPHLKITKLARGLPQGSDLEYADEVTLANAFKGRTEI